MTYQEAIEKAFTVKWKLGTCEQGERCWCRTIEPVEPIMYQDHEDIEPYFIVKSGQMRKDVANYFVELHNRNINSLGHSEPEIKTVTSKTGRIWAAENLEIDGKKHFTWQEAIELAPTGFRLPTAEEWEEEVQSWKSGDIRGALESPLNLQLAGYRDYSSGALDVVGSFGAYWSSSVSGSSARNLNFYSGYAHLNSYDRAYGFSVRYIKE